MCRGLLGDGVIKGVRKNNTKQSQSLLMSSKDDGIRVAIGHKLRLLKIS